MYIIYSVYLNGVYVIHVTYIILYYILVYFIYYVLLFYIIYYIYVDSSDVSTVLQIARYFWREKRGPTWD